MFSRRPVKAMVLFLLLFAGILLLAVAGGPAPETAQRQGALQALAPFGTGRRAIGNGGENMDGLAIVE